MPRQLFLVFAPILIVVLIVTTQRLVISLAKAPTKNDHPARLLEACS